MDKTSSLILHGTLLLTNLYRARRTHNNIPKWCTECNILECNTCKCLSITMPMTCLVPTALDSHWPNGRIPVLLTLLKSTRFWIITMIHHFIYWMYGCMVYSAYFSKVALVLKCKCIAPSPIQTYYASFGLHNTQSTISTSIATTTIVTTNATTKTTASTNSTTNMLHLFYTIFIHAIRKNVVKIVSVISITNYATQYPKLIWFF